MKNRVLESSSPGSVRDEGSDVLVYSDRFGVCLQELTELLDAKTSIANKTAHRKCVDWTVTGNG